MKLTKKNIFSKLMFLIIYFVKYIRTMIFLGKPGKCQEGMAAKLRLLPPQPKLENVNFLNIIND